MENGHVPERAKSLGMTKSASFLDVQSVEEESVPPAKRSKLSTVVNLLEARKAVQVGQAWRSNNALRPWAIPEI